jgi:tRNA threonylcarbamoyladenosine biosynthesis protein TsaB
VDKVTSVLLAFDTATPLVTVALHDGADVVAEASAVHPMRHGEQLAPLIDGVMSQVGVVRQDLTAVGVGVGPGPYTGLRVGLVTARTLGFVLEIPVYGLCTLDVVAVEAAETGSIVGDFVVATDARRKEVYLASYDASARRLDGPVVVRPHEAATDLPVAGEGARLYPDAFPHAVEPSRPSAGWLARALAEERAELFDPEPLYLRRPDADAPGPPKPVTTTGPTGRRGR